VLARYVARTLAWGPLLAGCLAGAGITVALLIFSGPIETPPDLATGVRASFVPVLAGLAFLLHDPQRQVAGALPAKAWRVPVTRLVITLPVLGLTGLIQMLVAGRALADNLRETGQIAAPLPWPGLVTELAAWCLLALALGAGIGRTRWQDVAGVVAAVGAMAVIGAAALLPLHLTPAAIVAMTAAQHRQWVMAWRVWAVAAAICAAAAWWAAGDPWRRLRSRLVWRLPAARAGLAHPG
jgi:hypothetical protein